MKTIWQGWNFIRILRLMLGGAIFVQGIVAKDPMTIVLGVIFGGMAVVNIGCCGTNGCAINTTSANKTKGINNEEPDSKQ